MFRVKHGHARASEWNGVSANAFRVKRETLGTAKSGCLVSLFCVSRETRGDLLFFAVKISAFCGKYFLLSRCNSFVGMI